jgi:hypothetical protein
MYARRFYFGAAKIRKLSGNSGLVLNETHTFNVIDFEYFIKEIAALLLMFRLPVLKNESTGCPQFPGPLTVSHFSFENIQGTGPGIEGNPAIRSGL